MLLLTAFMYLDVVGRGRIGEGIFDTRALGESTLDKLAGVVVVGFFVLPPLN